MRHGHLGFMVWYFKSDRELVSLNGDRQHDFYVGQHNRLEQFVYLQRLDREHRYGHARFHHLVKRQLAQPVQCFGIINICNLCNECSKCWYWYYESDSEIICAGEWHRQYFGCRIIKWHATLFCWSKWLNNSFRFDRGFCEINFKWEFIC